MLDVGTCGLHVVHNAFQHGKKQVTGVLKNIGVR